MQERSAGSHDLRRPVQRPQGRGRRDPAPATSQARSHGQGHQQHQPVPPSSSSSTTTSFDQVAGAFDPAQHAVGTPQSISTTSAANTPTRRASILEYPAAAAPPPQPPHYPHHQQLQLQLQHYHQQQQQQQQQHLQLHPLPSPRDQMSIGQSQPANPTAVDYGRYAYQPGGALLWDQLDGSTLDLPTDFARFYEPQGELVRELQDQHQPQADFVLPEPVPAGGDAGGPLDTAGHPQQTIGGGGVGAPLSPRSMPIVLGGVQPQPAQGYGSLKRKSESDPSVLPPSGVDDSGSGPSSKRPARERTASATALSPVTGGSMATRTRASNSATQPTLTVQTPGDSDTAEVGPSGQPHGSDAGNRSPTGERSAGAGKARKVQEAPARFSNILPAGKVFPIQIGSELFRLSGASISSDGALNFIKFALNEVGQEAYVHAAPSYFSHFFSEQVLNTNGKSGTIRTLYIDRDPQTFRDISLHLQGYHVKPRDGEHYVRLFADAQFYSLPRLTQQLFKTDIYIQIGDRNFQIPRDIFSAPGNSPNFFSLGFAHFFSTPSEVFPGLDRTSLLRPPSIQPPSVPNRSADVFQDLLHLLQGYPVNIRDEGHRQDLLRDARYFHLKGLEQKLIPCNISFNLARQQSEIVVRLEDIRQSGVSFQPEADTSGPEQSADTGGGNGSGQQNSMPASGNKIGATPPGSLTPAAAASGYTTVPTGYIRYARPFTDEAAHSLVVEVSSTEATRIDLSSMRATFADQTKARIASLFQVIANKMNLPATQPLGLMMVERGGGLAAMPVSPSNSGVSGDRVRVSIDRDAWCEVNGGVVEWDEDDTMGEASMSASARGGMDEDGASDTQRQHRQDDSTTSTSSAAPAARPSLPPVRRWRPSGAGVDSALDPLGEWVVGKAHWRLRVQPSVDDARIVEVVMQVVKLQAWVGERVRNGSRPFLM